MPSANRLLGVIGRDGELHLHAPSVKFPVHYMVGSETLVILSRMGNAISNRNQTMRPNADARLAPVDFYEPTVNRQIAIREPGLGKRLTITRIAYGAWWGLKLVKGTKEAIAEMESLIRGHRVGSNSAENPSVANQ